MGSTDNFLPGTPVASAAATVPDIELVEEAEAKAAEARTEDVLLSPTNELTEVGTDDEEVGIDDEEVGTDDEEAGTFIEEIAIAGEL